MKCNTRFVIFLGSAFFIGWAAGVFAMAQARRKRGRPCTSSGDPVHETAGSGTTAARRFHRNEGGEFAVAPQVEAKRRERLAAMAEEISTASGLPATLSRHWAHELAMISMALDQCGEALEAGLLSKKLRLRAVYLTFLKLSERAATLTRLLGLEAAAPAANKSKAWTKLSREEQERAAEEAFDAVARNLGENQS